MPGKYHTDSDLISELLAFRTAQELTNSQLCRMLGIEGVTTTYLSKYLNDNLDREVPGFELLARDVLKSIRERIEFGGEIFETSVTRRMGHCLSLIRKTGDIALITAPAGNGKSSGIGAFVAENPSTVAITLNATTRAANKVESLVFSAVEHRDWKGTTSRFDYLVERFKKSSRLLIVDNAQRLDSSGRQWLFDFCDAAEMPTALIGNPETLDRIRVNDQQFSRIGIHASYELEDRELPSAARRIAAQFSDGAFADAVEDLCAYIASKDGRLRAVRKTVILARALADASADLMQHPRKAIRAAHSRLVRDYALPND